MSAQAPKPIAEGTLAKTPLAHVLVNVAVRRLSGTLAVWPDPGTEGEIGQDRVRFDQGVAVAMRPLAPLTNMDRALGALFTRRAAPYAFYEADLVGTGAEVLTGRGDPYALIARALRGPADEGAIDAVLSRLGEAPLTLREDAPLDRLGLEVDEQEVAERMKLPASVGQVVGEWPDRALARRVLYLLAITRSIGAARQGAGAASLSPPPDKPSIPSDARQASQSPAQPRTSKPTPTVSGTRAVSSKPPGRERRSSRAPAELGEPPMPPDHLPAELGTRWMEIVDRSNALEEQTYFDMLGVGRSDGPAAVRDAYFEQVKRWHPDRMPTELLPLKPWVERIFQYVTEARDTLSDPEQRGPYVKAVQSGGGTPASERRVTAIVGAAMEFQKVEVFARRKNWGEALATLEQALALNAEEADYYAMRAWLLLQKHGADESAPVADMLRDVDHALKLDAECVRGHYTKGLVLKRVGKMREAYAHFQKVTELDPKHIEAAREVRLAEMRARSSTAPPPLDGRPSFLSKLFGSKKK